MSKSVTIIAMGASHSDYTTLSALNQGASTDEVWAINAMANVIKHDKAIIMDDLPLLIGRLPGYEFVYKHDKPIVTSKAYEHIPKSETYPLEDVVNHIGLPYLNTTVAYAFALAWYEGFKEIRLFGADFTYPDAHAAESGRGNVEFLIGAALRDGVKTFIGMNSTLMDMNVSRKFYGYADHIEAQRQEDGSLKLAIINENKKAKDGSTK